MIRRFARPYAKAIFEVSGSPQKAEGIRDELARFDSVRASAKDLQDLYANPGVELDAKLKITSSIAKRLGLSELTVKVLELLIRNHRINNLDSISEALMAMVRDATGRVAAEVRSAHSLSDQELNDLRRTLETKVGRKVDVDVRVDETLIGGFVAKIGSEVYDTSVVTKLQKIRTPLT